MNGTVRFAGTWRYWFLNLSNIGEASSYWSGTAWKCVLNAGLYYRMIKATCWFVSLIRQWIGLWNIYLKARIFWVEKGEKVNCNSKTLGWHVGCACLSCLLIWSSTCSAFDLEMDKCAFLWKVHTNTTETESNLTGFMYPEYGYTLCELSELSVGVGRWLDMFNSDQ